MTAKFDKTKYQDPNLVENDKGYVMISFENEHKSNNFLSSKVFAT